MTWEKILLLGIFVESTVKWFKKEYRNRFTYLALFLGIVLAFATKANLLTLLDIKDYSPFKVVGNTMSGVVLARGANFLNELASQLFRKKFF